MRPPVWQAVLTAAALAYALVVPAPTSAQDASRVAATVDYVSTDGLYLTVGADQGAARGDTVAIFADSTSSEPLGRIVLTSVTRRRSVARPLDPSLEIRLGSTFYVHFDAPPATAAGPPPPPSSTTTAVSTRVAATRGASPGARLSGRLALDFDARETRTSWSGDLFGETHRRFATPTARLTLFASELPGGFSARANLRGSYRYDELQAGPPPLSVRAYELSVSKEFEALPLVLTIGRFANPYESYSAYWDGALLRVGRESGLGVGVVAGFEPTRHDEAFSSALPKVTGFADFRARGADWRYDTDVSVHYLRPDGGNDQTYAGWSQRLSLGPVDVTQRIRLDGGLDGRRVSVGDARVRAGIELGGPFRLRGTYGRTRSMIVASGTPLTLIDAAAGPVREETTVGLDALGGRASASLDVGRTRRDGASAGVSLAGSAGLRIGGGGIQLAGQTWSRGAAESLSASSSIDGTLGPVAWRTGYRFYRTDAGIGSLVSHAVEAQAGLEVTTDLHLSVRAERQWGEHLSGTALRVGLWRGF